MSDSSIHPGRDKLVGLIVLIVIVVVVGIVTVWWVAQPTMPKSSTSIPPEMEQHRLRFDTLNRAKSDASEGRFEDALDVFEQLIEVNADDEIGRESDLFAAHMLAALGRHAEAQARYAQVAQNAGDDGRARIGAAETLSYAGDHAQAARQLNELVESLSTTRPDQCAEALFALHRVHRRDGRDGAARAALGRIVEEFPGLESADRRRAESAIAQLRLDIVARQESRLAELSTTGGGRVVASIVTDDTDWNATAGPYLITGEITVPSDAVLRIGPGTDIRFGAQGRLVVNGRIEAVGTSADPIAFRPLDDDPDNAMWPGLRFASSSNSQPSRIEHARIVAAESAIACTVGEVEVRHVAIHKAAGVGLHVRDDGGLVASDVAVEDGAYVGVRCDRGGRLTLERVTVQGNVGLGIHCALTLEPVSMVDVTVRNNGRGGVLFRTASGQLAQSRIIGNGGAGVVCRGQASPKLVGNGIRDNREAGIRVVDGCEPHIEGNRIEANQGDGIVFDLSSKGEIRGNAVAANTGAGVRCLAGSSPTIVANDIRENQDTGVWLLSGAAPILHDNSFRDNRPTDLRNHSSHEIDARQNHWHTADAEEIARRIEDRAEDDRWGRVNYLPFREAPVPALP